MSPQRPSGAHFLTSLKTPSYGFFNAAISQQNAEQIYSGLMCPFLYFPENTMVNAFLLSKICEMFYFYLPRG